MYKSSILLFACLVIVLTSTAQKKQPSQGKDTTKTAAVNVDAKAPKTLNLSINDSNKNKIFLASNGKTPLKASDSLNFKNANWTFTINNAISKNAEVYLIQVEGDDAGKPVLLSEKSYTIRENILGQNQFRFFNSFKILVKKKNGNEIATYTLFYTPENSTGTNNGGNTISNITGNTTDNTTDNTTGKATTKPEFNASSLVYDALFLSGEGDLPKKLAVWAKIAGTKDDINEIKAKFGANPYLEPYLKKFEGKAIAEAGIGISSILSSIGGLDVTKIADGFAKFLVKRTKQELNETFFRKFRETLMSENYRDLRTVFPQTYRALLVIGDEIYRYEAYIQTLRENFENDLATLDKNLPTILDNHPDFFVQYPQLAVILTSSCYVANALENGVHPGDAIRDFPTTGDYWDNPKMNKNWKGAIQMIQLVSGSLMDTTVNTDSVYWVNTKTIKELVKNKDAFDIYLGLLYYVAQTEYSNIQFEGDHSLVKFLDTLYPFTKYRPDYEQFIQDFAVKANKLNLMIKAYKKPANDSLVFEQYYQYFKASVDLLKQATEISKLPIIKDVIPPLSKDMADYFEAAYASADLVVDINRRNYSSVVVDAVHIYDLVIAKYVRRKDPTQKDKKKSDTAISVQAKNDVAVSVGDNLVNGKIAPESLSKKYIDSLVQVQVDYLKKHEDISIITKSDVSNKMYKYGSFMAALVQAKSSDEVAATIEAVALPSGSSRVKREAPFNVAINAYVGLYAGYERINGIDNKSFRINSAGLSAPIGVAVSKGGIFLSKKRNSAWSASLFVSLVDLGAIAAFRFKDDSTILGTKPGQGGAIDTTVSGNISQTSTIQLKHIVSPGAFISIGIPKSPISVNFGVQVGPNLRKIQVNANGFPVNSYQPDDQLYVRFSASFCVDIPVFNLYTKSR
jgi:hypothetical protein